VLRRGVVDDFFMAAKKIKKGEELLFDYGDKYWKYTEPGPDGNPVST
jgi:SET domain-containing protein